MDERAARDRAAQYNRIGWAAEARAKAAEDAHWFVYVKSAYNGEMYEEYDVRVTDARHHYIRQFARKPDRKCVCGYDPMTQQELEDHISQGYMSRDGKDHG